MHIISHIFLYINLYLQALYYLLLPYTHSNSSIPLIDSYAFSGSGSCSFDGTITNGVFSSGSDSCSSLGVS